MASLADIGLMSSGFNEAMAADTARRKAEEDRLYELDQRRQKQERDLAAQEEFRRNQAYVKELRDTMPQFLAGGAQGVPARAAVPGQELDPRQQEGGQASIAAVAATPAQDNMAGLYEKLQEVAGRHGQLDHYEAMKERVKKLADEGVIDFIKKARQGATEDELLKAFNKNGKVKLADLRKVSADEYRGTTADNKEVNFNLTRMTESLLGAKDLLAHQDKAELTNAKIEMNAKTNEAKNVAAEARLDAKRAQIDAGAGLLSAREEAARARAERDRAVAANGGKGGRRTAGNQNAFDREVRMLAEKTLTSNDPDTGKPILDRKNLVTLTSMANTLGRDDSTLSPSEAIAAAQDQLDEIRRIQDQAQTQAEDESANLKFKDTKQRESWVRNRAEKVAKARKVLQGSDASGAAPAKEPTPTKEAAAPAERMTRTEARLRDVESEMEATGGIVEEPKTQADFDALPAGAFYVNPKDGKTYRKKK